MAKRFIDTDLFRKPLVRGLQGPYKILWIYLLCECDHAGVWDIELDVAAMRLGVKLDPAKCRAALGTAVMEIDGGKKWWLPEFVSFQYGKLNRANRVHASVISTLEKYGAVFFEDIGSFFWKEQEEGAYKGLASPLQGAKDKEQEKASESVKVERASVDERRLERIMAFSAKCHSVNDERKILDPIALAEFVAYWTEASEGAAKFRAELQDAFQHDRRMVKWADRAKTFRNDHSSHSATLHNANPNKVHTGKL